MMNSNYEIGALRSSYDDQYSYGRMSLTGDDADTPNEGGDLSDAVSDEEGYVRDLLRKELGREPTDEDMDDWIRQQTESF